MPRVKAGAPLSKEERSTLGRAFQDARSILERMSRRVDIGDRAAPALSDPINSARATGNHRRVTFDDSYRSATSWTAS